MDAGHQGIDREHVDFPPRLLDLRDAPLRLFVRGTLPRATRPVVAIVGSRRPSREAERFAFELALELGRCGVVIVSGGARGIDAAAHSGALAAGASTVAILAGDVGRPSPASNRLLFKRILAGGGAIVAERAELPEHGGGFIVRNRLIAAWAQAVVVVEARLRSGTQSTATFARRLSRPLYAVPWSPYHGPGAGCLRLLEEGAMPLSSVRPIAAMLGLSAPRPSDHTQQPPVAGPAGALLDAIQRNQGASLDQLAGLVRLSMSSLLATLSELELEGLVENQGAGRYRVCRPAD